MWRSPLAETRSVFFMVILEMKMMEAVGSVVLCRMIMFIPNIKKNY
jgi:hypothetical protein